MNREFQARFTAILLGLMTVAAVVFAGYNYKVERQTAIPDDGVWWLERNGHLTADHLDPNGPRRLPASAKAILSSALTAVRLKPRRT